MVASRSVSAVLSFRTHPIVFPLRSLRGRCRLRQMRCKYIRAVGATFFQRRINAGADTFIAVARPVGSGKTVAGGTDKSVPYERPLAAAES